MEMVVDRKKLYGLEDIDFNDEYIDMLIHSNFQSGKTVREPQLRSLRFLIKSFIEGKKHCILQLPTGVGKSLIADTFSKIFKNLTVSKPHLNGTTVITKTKALQEQYVEEFIIPSLKGQGNYPCYLPNSNFSYGDVECFKKRGDCNKSLCAYLKSMDRWRKNKEFKVTNFSLSLSCSPKTCGSTEDGDFTPLNLIIDECHEFPETLIDQSTFEFKSNSFDMNKFKYPEMNFNNLEEKLQEFFGLLMTKNQTRFVVAQPELEEFLLFLKKEIEYYQPSIISGSATSGQIVYYKYIEDFARKLAKLWGKDIVFYMKEEEENGSSYFKFIIKPLFESELAVSYFNQFDFVIHMSATIGDLDLYAKNLGLVDYSTYEEASPFKLENREIVFANIVNFNYNNRDEALKIMLDVMDQLLEHHFAKGENGIIHVSSYFQANYLLKHSKFKKKLRVPKNAYEVDIYKSKYTLISPSMHEGYDFKDDLARFQILIKLPYPSLGDEYIKVKSDLVDGWYEKQTLNKFVQAYGRGIRHYDDWCIFYVLDGNFGRHMNSSVIPNYVKDAITQK